MVNAYTVYCYNNPKKKERLTHLRFRLAVATALLQSSEPAPVQRHLPVAPEGLPLRLTGRHFPEPAGGQPDCKVCSDRGEKRRKQTQWQSKSCKVAVYLPLFRTLSYTKALQMTYTFSVHIIISNIVRLPLWLHLCHTSCRPS